MLNFPFSPFYDHGIFSLLVWIIWRRMVSFSGCAKQCKLGNSRETDIIWSALSNITEAEWEEASVQCIQDAEAEGGERGTTPKGEKS